MSTIERSKITFMKLNWKEKTTSDKVMTIFVIVCSSLIIILSLLQMMGVLEKANNVVVTLVAIVFLLQAIREWKEQRIMAIFSLCIAILYIFGVFIILFT